MTSPSQSIEEPFYVMSDSDEDMPDDTNPLAMFTHQVYRVSMKCMACSSLVSKYFTFSCDNALSTHPHHVICIECLAQIIAFREETGQCPTIFPCPECQQHVELHDSVAWNFINVDTQT